MSIFSYYARDNKEAILNNRISALKRLIKQYGENFPFYPIYKEELSKAEEKLKQLKIEDNIGKSNIIKAIIEECELFIKNNLKQ